MKIVFTEKDIDLLLIAVEYSLQFGGMEHNLSLQGMELWRSMNDLKKRLEKALYCGMEKNDAKKIDEVEEVKQLLKKKDQKVII